MQHAHVCHELATQVAPHAHIRLSSLSTHQAGSCVALGDTNVLVYAEQQKHVCVFVISLYIWAIFTFL